MMKIGLAVLLLATSACTSSGNAGSSDASAGDGGGVASGAIRCSASLTSVCNAATPFPISGGCPPSSASGFPGPWCAANPYSGPIRGACDGYSVLEEGGGVDCDTLFLYSTSSGELKAAFGSCNYGAPECIGGDPDFSISPSCFAPGDIENGVASPFGNAAGAPACTGYDAGETGPADASACLGAAGSLSICFPDGAAATPICVTGAFCAKLSNFIDGVGGAIEYCEAFDDTPCTGGGACATKALAKACPDPTAAATCTTLVAACADASAPLAQDASAGDGGAALFTESICEQSVSGLTSAGRQAFTTCMTATCDVSACVAGLL